MVHPSAFQKHPAYAEALPNIHIRLPDKAPRAPDPRTNKRHPETGLHAPKDHQDQGTSFKLPLGARLGLPSESRLGKRALFNSLTLIAHSVES
ncbi:hypothetical protein CRG98_050029 [Punica granatum]|uniref:Uncharacterized protein n=1 Tax=Punica granatum TaxID=22663 RepID=A0A2I0GTC8_PUNGR|nr:hypothetical protein CRG98_050029 [Punica granatum]